MENLELHPSKIHILNNAKFVEFMTKVDAEIQTSTVITTTLSVLTTKFTEFLVKLKESLVANRGNSYTERLEMADRLRDVVHAGVVSYSFCKFHCI